MKSYKEYIFKNILRDIEKPARYTGGEFNSQVVKEDADVTFAFAFADTYEIGMSHLGMKILYEVLNNEDGVMCERVFAPTSDMSTLLTKHNIPLVTLESMSSIKDFDFLGFTIQYEMSLTTTLMMLDLGGIPFYSKDRKKEDPIVICGGPCTYNPAPYEKFFDLVLMGEGEEMLPRLMDIYKEVGKNKEEFLIKASEVEGVYVPNVPSLKKDYIKKAIIKDMNNVYTIKKPIVPYVSPAHDRVSLEIMRGCMRGCRFCQAGMIYRPTRFKSLETLKKEADTLIKSTGYEEISLSSLSTTDHPYCMDITKYIVEEYKSKYVNLSLPSLRMDSFSLNLAKEVSSLKKSSMTFAPEAGSQRMRDVINKNLTKEDILSTIKKVYEGGNSKIKLYFMIGLPYETMEDIKAISDLCNDIVKVYYSIEKPKRPKPFALTLSTSCFVPKAFTPFQWAKQNTIEEFMEKQKYLKSILPKNVKYNYHEAKLSVLEGAFSRGGDELNEVLVKAYEKGCTFDSWYEHFDYEKWQEAFLECGINLEEYASREFSFSEEFPWDFVDIGVDKDFLLGENIKAKKSVTTKGCNEKCSQCGIRRRFGRCELNEV